MDVFKRPGKSFELQVMGTFEVSDGKIRAWRDYFDQKQFTSRISNEEKSRRCRESALQQAAKGVQMIAAG
jgi:hypothetical protein